MVDDLILMESDSGILAKRKASIEHTTAQLMVSVEHDLESTQIAGHPIFKDHKSTVSYPATRVQPGKVADDE